MDSSPESSTTPVQDNAARFVAYVRDHKGRFDAPHIDINNGRGPFVAILALFPRSTAPSVKVVVGRGLAVVVHGYSPPMQPTTAESFRELCGVAIDIAHHFEGVDCGGTHEEIRRALAPQDGGEGVLVESATRLLYEDESVAILAEVRDHLPRCVVCDGPATRRKQGSLFVKPEFGCDVHMPGAEELKWARLARLVNGVEERRRSTKGETAYSPITDEAVLDLYRGILAEMEPGDDGVEVGELLADMRHANLGPDRASRVAYLSDMLSRHVLSTEGVGLRRISL